MTKTHAIRGVDRTVLGQSWLMARLLLVYGGLKGKNRGEGIPKARWRSIHFARYSAVSLRRYKCLLDEAPDD